MRLAILVGVLCLFAQAFAQNVSLDKKLGAENALLVEREMGIYLHDSLQRLINSIGSKLVSRLKNNPFEFKFFLVDTEEPNAFALPGGYVYVSRGILPLIQTEDELAGIMAHEIIHITQRHSVKQVKKGAVTGLLTVPGKILNTVTGTSIGNVLNAPITLTTKAFISKYSRGHESEADKFGIQLAASAGYKTEALADALERLSKEVELVTGNREKQSYFSSHPYTPGRVKSIRSSAGQYKPVNPSPVYANRNAFLNCFNALCFGPNPKQGIFKDTLFVHPDMQFSWFIPSQWPATNKPAVVTSVAKSGDAMVSLHVLDEKRSVTEIGETVKQKASEAKGVTVTVAKDTTINSNPSYMLRLTTLQREKEVVAELVWLRFGNLVFQLSGIAEPAQLGTVHRSLVSFRKSSSDELKLVVGHELRVVSPHAGETLEQLSARTGNRLTGDYTKLINNLAGEPDSAALVKIVQAVPYRK